MFSIDFKTTAKELLEKYPKKQYALLPLLHLIQKEKGQIDSDAINYIAKMCGISFNHVQGVVSFYSMFSQEKRAKNKISVCTNLSCWIKGSTEIVEQLEKKLKIKAHENNPENTFFLETVECLGACGSAPVMIVNDKYKENLTVEKIDQIVDAYSK